MVGRSTVAEVEGVASATSMMEAIGGSLIIGDDKTAIMVLKKFELEGALAQENLMIKSGVLRDENPLDTSEEFNEFLVACRHGDLRKCQELISEGVNINGKDKFDYTGLIIVSCPDPRGLELTY